VQFGILGSLEVRSGSETIEIAPMQLRRLLCILLLAPGRPVPTSTVIECLWPSDDASVVQPTNATKTLRIYASRLRGHLPDTAGPKFDVRGYWLGVSEEHVDAGRFEDLLRLAAKCPDADPASSAEHLRDALTLWRGPALADCRDEPWALAAATRLDELRLTAIERLTDARLLLGDHDHVCAELEHFVAENPYRERAWGQLMIALYRSGRQADALRTFQRLRRLLGEELGIEPGKELVELDAAIVRQDPALDLAPPTTHVGSGARPGVGAPTAGAAPDLARAPAEPRVRERPQQLQPGLPVVLNRFVGRARELDELRSLVTSRRLVTLTGPGGVGKTRLALEAVREQWLRRPNDAFVFVDLSTVRDPAEVPQQVARELGVTPPSDAAILPVLARAVGDEALLLILDNCEHVAASSATVCETLLRACTALSIVATSRQPLSAEGETIYALEPLELPPDTSDEELAALPTGDCVELFVERARAVLPSFAVNESNAVAVASICRRVDGIPLAVELAAARLNVLTPAQINGALEEQFRLLGRQAPSAAPRHATIDALIGWSYELLEAEERSLLRRLAVFPGGFDLEGAAAVADGTSASPWTILDGLSSLVDKSLVVADTTGTVARYQLLETIRQYGNARLLAEDGEAVLGDVRRAHATYFVQLAERAGEGLWSGHPFPWIDQLELELVNIRAAFDYLIDEGLTHDAMRILASIGKFFTWCRNWDWTGFAAAFDGRRELSEIDRVAIEVCIIRAQVLGWRDPKAAGRDIATVLQRARELGDDALTAIVLHRLHWQMKAVGNDEEATRMHEEALALARKSGNQRALVIVLTARTSTDELTSLLELTEEAGLSIASYFTLLQLADQALVADDAAAAFTYGKRALAIGEAGHSTPAMAEALVNIGLALVLEGDTEAAREAYRRAVELSRREGDPVDLGAAFLGVGLCASSDGDLATASMLFGAARQRLDLRGISMYGAEGKALEAEEARIRSFIGQAKFEAAVERGRTLSKDNAADLALGRLGPALPVKGVATAPAPAGVE
jgi:predicted ATPase/DNA-binding SARP family transcriptional activator